MSKRVVNFLMGILSLFLGFALYLLFRENTYISRLFAQVSTLKTLRSMFIIFSCDFLMYYLPDFLWGFSLSCLLQAFCVYSFKGTVLCCCITAIYGCVWELLQWLSILGGTGDYLDIIMYLLASILCLIINLKERKV